MSRSLINLLAYAMYFDCKAFSHALQYGGVDPHAGLFHTQQNRHEGEIDRLVNVTSLQRSCFVAEHRGECMHSVRSLRELFFSCFLQWLATETRGNIAQTMRSMRRIHEVRVQH